MIQLGFGDTLVRYADGVTEAPDVQEELFDEERLLGTVQANIGRSAQAIQDALITEIDKSVGGVPQFDDITLKILVRGSNDLWQTNKIRSSLLHSTQPQSARLSDLS